MSLRSEKEAVRAKVLMVVNALAKRATAAQLAEEQLLSGLSAKQVAAHLRTLGNAGEVKHYKDKTWGPIKSRELPTTATKTNGAVPTNMHFVINVSERSIMLDVGGLRLPVTVE